MHTYQCMRHQRQPSPQHPSLVALPQVQATALRLMRLVQPPSGGLAGLLHMIEQQHRKSCDTDVGGCGAANAIAHALRGQPPRVFSLQLAWEGQQVPPTDIAATLRQVQEGLDLAALYGGLDPGAHHYRLRSMVAYYGAHYQAFVFMPDLQRWVLLDDAAVSSVGGWGDVVRKCEAGRIQPSVLFYEAAPPA